MFAQEKCYFDKRMVIEDFYSRFPGEYIYDNRKSISFFYSIPFNLRELSTKSLNLALDFNKSYRFESFICDFGSDKYFEQKTGISLSKNFGKYIVLGISYNLMKTSIKNYSELYDRWSGVGGSLNFKLIKITFYKTVKKNIEDNRKFLQVLINPGDNILINCLLKKENSFHLQRVYNFIVSGKLFDLSISLGEHPTFYSFGVSFLIKKLEINCQLREDLNLGTSQFFCLCIYL